MSQVSVIIPTFNQARFLGTTVESVLAQSYRDMEIIVVNDGSTDETPAVLAEYEGRIQVIVQENRGLSAARNAGYHASGGDCVLFLDSDDVLLPDSLTRQAAVLAAQPQAGLVYSAWRQISEDGTKILGEVHPNEQDNVLEKLLLRRFFFFASTALIRRECLKRVGLFDEALVWGEDADMWLRIAKAGYAFGYLDEPLVLYRVHRQSMTASIHADQVAGWQLGLEKFFADPDLPARIRALRAKAASVLHYETAGRYFRIGAVELAQAQLSQAVQADPDHDDTWFLQWVVGTALDARTPDPLQLINFVFDHLGQKAARWRHLRRRAQGHFHAASVFEGYQRKDLNAARQHVLPAIRGDSSILFNRGFLSIALKSVFDWSGES